MLALAIVVGLAASEPTLVVSRVAVTVSVGPVAERMGPALPTRGCPEIVQHPQPMTAWVWNPLEASVIASGAGLTYQWRQNEVNLEDDGRIVGSRGPHLTINPCRVGDRGQYDVVVTSGTCSVESNDAELFASCYPSCTYYGLGPLGLYDFGCFQTRFALGQAYADCNGDTLLNVSDFGCFMTKFAVGCP